MTESNLRRVSRRQFLTFLASCPIWPSMIRAGDTGIATSDQLIETLGQIFDVFDLQVAAKQRMPIAHYGYLATGVDGELTLKANEEAFARIGLRPRRLADVSDIDMGVTLFGEKWRSPILLAPAGSQNAFHADGELATARAARQGKHLQILSSVTTHSVEAVTEARGAPVWYQLYPTSNWDITKMLLRRAEDAGSPVVVLTVDLPVISNRLTAKRARQADTRDCTECHREGKTAFFDRKPMYDGTGISGFAEFDTPGWTWEFVDRLREATSMKVVLKGIVTREDAALCMEHGVDGVVVSNHGGRAEESGVGAIENLPEVVAEIDGRIPVLMDSGIRRGIDIFKAIALGADAVCVGRPYLWGLGAFGQAGVETALRLLTQELKTTMALMGTPSLADISRSHTIV